jgi:transcriptional regulator with AAA-type ATPase domain
VRPADILDFERYYMRVISKEQSVKLTLTQEAERALLAYSFPENVEVRICRSSA